MGQEIVCTAEFQGQRAKGKAFLETSEIMFRAANGEFRLKIPFAKIQSLHAAAGKLHLKMPDGPAIFALGPSAEKWLEKIKNPKSRLEKLGVKPGARVALLGNFDAEFRAELRQRTGFISTGKTSEEIEWIFFAAESPKELARVPVIADSLAGSAAFWIVYPKGQKYITESQVLTAGRKAGLKDVKVVGFSPTHTALKFVIPVSLR